MPDRVNPIPTVNPNLVNPNLVNPNLVNPNLVNPKLQKSDSTSHPSMSPRDVTTDVLRQVRKKKRMKMEEMRYSAVLLR
eukprot:140974-Hanusia_phi.AAC.1